MGKFNVFLRALHYYFVGQLRVWWFCGSFLIIIKHTYFIEEIDSKEKNLYDNPLLG